MISTAGPKKQYKSGNVFSLQLYFAFSYTVCWESSIQVKIYNLDHQLRTTETESFFVLQEKVFLVAPAFEGATVSNAVQTSLSLKQATFFQTFCFSFVRK